MTKPLAARSHPNAFLACSLLFVVAFSISIALFGSRDNPVRFANPVDLRAFRCGATVALSGANPYLNEPLRSCEHAMEMSTSATSFARIVVMPVPLPPYAFALYAPLAKLSTDGAMVAFTIASVCAAIYLIIQLKGLTSIHALALSPIVIFGIWLPSAQLGQPTIFVCAALVGLAAIVRSGGTLAALPACIIAALAPHLVLPSFIALASKKRTRPLVVLAGTSLLLISIAVGVALTSEYVLREVSSHGLSEVRWFGGQYTVAALLAAMGVSPAHAVKVNDLCWLGATVASIIYARKLAIVHRDEAYLVLLPPALALPWAPFLHATWIGLAIPGTLLILRDNKNSRLALASIILLSIPWADILQLLPQLAMNESLQYKTETRPDLLASDVWHGFIDALARAESRPAWLLALMKLPTWIAFATLTLCVTFVVDPTRRPTTQV